MARETEGETEMAAREGLLDEADSLQPNSNLYEAQFFGFTPDTCMLRIYSAFQDCLCEMLVVVEKVCVRHLKSSEADEERLRSQARECTRKLQLFLDERFKQISQRMGPLLVNRCLSVPTNVLLPENQQHRNYPQDVQELLRLESSIADLQGAYEAEVCARQALLAELEEQKEVLKQLNGIQEWVTELQAAWVREGMGSFHESFRLVTESVKRLEDAIGEICSKAVK
ncbi:protein MIS12 homolog [Genypterus blacodes]|uniref:protein MIS12 homolog n=1 Tax=Genypterus blacodes TaxID=154954 RepID=UPI003F76B6A6